MARNFVAASSNYLTLPYLAASAVHARTAGAVSGWFKTSNAGTSRLVIYDEIDTADDFSNLFLSVNDGTAGLFRVFRRDSAATQMGSSNSPTGLITSGGYNDGAWHFFTYTWSALNDHALFIDGSSVATSTDLLESAQLNVGKQTIGRRSSATPGGYFDGDIADISLWAGAVTLAQHTELFNQTKHAFNVQSYSNLRSYWTLAAQYQINGQDLKDRIRHISGTAATNNGTTASAGPNSTDSRLPAGMVLTTDLSQAWIWDVNIGTTLVSVSSTGTDQDANFREPGNVVHDPDDATRTYKMYFAGHPDTYTGDNVAIIMAYTSPDLSGSWTKEGVVITNATLPAEDPWVYRNPADGTYHLYCENKTGGTNAGGIAYFSSSDGVTWTLQDATVIDKGAGGEWDNQDVSSPIVWLENSTWYMIYEGRGTSTNGDIGLATASAPEGPWTKEATNPVLTRGTSGTWDDDAMVPDDLVLIDATYWLTYHGSDGTNFQMGVASSSNLTSWTKSELNPVSGLTGSFQRMGGTEFGRIYTADRDSGGEQNIIELGLIGSAAVQTEEWPSATSSITGTLSVTLADDTLASTATVDIEGSVSATLADDTLSATSTVAITAALSATLADDTLTASASVDVAGTLSQTLADDTLEATGTTGGSGVNGTLNVTLSDDTLTATATVDVVGVMSTTLADDTLAATATTGGGEFTLSATLADDTLVSTAENPVQGSLSATLADDTLSATGTTGGATPAGKIAILQLA